MKLTKMTLGPATNDQRLAGLPSEPKEGKWVSASEQKSQSFKQSPTSSSRKSGVDSPHSKTKPDSIKHPETRGEVRSKGFTELPAKAIAYLAIASTATGCFTVSDSTDFNRPNIILVMTDDQGYGDLGCHGHPFLKTPNLDRLYNQSARFTDFHVSPTCAPTRSALMSGRAPFKNGVTHTILERDRMTLKATTIAEVLQKAGYKTGIFGKWHLGDDDAYQPHNRGFDETFIHGAGGIGQKFPGTQGDAPGTGYFNPIIKHNNSFVKTKGYCTDVFFQQALGWIRKNKDKPFFAYIPTNAPHGPFIVADKYKDMYKDKAKGSSIAFFGMITNIDENMGLLMEKLDEWNLSDNTLLIFMTDNGTARGTFNYGMRGRKGSNHEGGSRVPLFMRLPGKIKAGVDIDRLTRHYDLFPTLAEIAKADIPDGLELDGRSLVPLIKNPNCAWKDRYTFFHKGRWNKEGAKGRWGKGNTDPDKAKYNGFAVRNEKWRLVGKELYDIEKDPGETKDVAKENPEVAKEMLKAYDEWWDKVRPLLINEDASLNTGKPFVEQYEKQKKETGIPEWNPPEL
jgi:arylsulfatase A-like enzyme